MKRHMPIFLTILSGIVFLFFGCQVIPSKPAEEPGKTDLSTSTSEKKIPTNTVTAKSTATTTSRPDLKSTALIQTLFAPTPFVQSYNLTQTAAPVNIDPLIAEYSGDYLFGDGEGSAMHIILNPPGLFEYSYFIDIGYFERINGEVSVQDGHFILSPKLRLGESHFFWQFPLDSINGEVIPFRWGDRRYLVPINESEITWFCNMVNSGSEPRNKNPGFAFLNLEDVTKDAGQLTDFPGEISWCILQEPITGIITQLDDNIVTINLGSDQGVFVDMTLYTNTSPSCFISIDNVNAIESIGKLHYPCDDVEVGGIQVSSRK